MATAASSLQFDPTHGSQEECSSCGPGEAATATVVHKGEDAEVPQGTAAAATSSLEFEHTSGAPEECSSGSPGKTMDATVSKGDETDGDSSYVIVDHAESDGTGEGDVHVIGEVVVPDEAEVDSEVNDNCLQNFSMVAEDLDANSSPSPPMEDDEAEMRKAFENDILLQVIAAAEVENKSSPGQSMGGHLVTDNIHLEHDENDLIPYSSFEVTHVVDGSNDFEDSVSENTSRCEAEVIRIEDVDNALPYKEETHDLTLITVETSPRDDEKTTPRDVKSSSGNDETNKSSSSDFQQMPDDSFDVEASFDKNDRIPPNDSHDEHKCDNAGMSQAISADSIAILEVDIGYQNKLATCEVVMDRPDCEQFENEDSNDVHVSNNENDLKEAVIDHVSSSSDLFTNSKFYMVRVPRILDSKLSEQVDLAQRQLEERTHQRESIRKEIQNKKAICNTYGKDFNEAKEEEKAARLAFSMKCKEVEQLKSMVADINTRGLVDNIAVEMQHLEHKIQHETMSLKEEKLLLRKIKELKQNHASLSLKIGNNSQLHKALEEKTQIEGQIKHLSFELAILRNKLFQAKTRTDTSKKKCDEGYNVLRELQAQHKVADDLRQQGYMNMRNLKKELSLKNRHFYKYKDDVNVAANYASSRNLKALQKHCIQQVELIMELWNKNDEFRKSYVLSNQFSTIRRFKTLDGRSLGPDEEPATLPTVGRNPTTNSTVLLKVGTTPHDEPTHENVGKTLVSADADRSSLKMEQKKISNESNKESVSKLEITSALAVVEQNEDRAAIPDDENVTNITGDDVARVELMKQEAAEELKAKIIAEQKAKRKEAEERKRRKAEKAKALADTRAQREAELREKKRAKKRTESTTSCLNDTTSVASNVETPACATEAVEAPEYIHVLSAKPSTFSSAPRSYYKVKPLPPTLRYKGKRKSYTLAWVLLPVVLAILFLLGNHLSLYHI